MDSTRSADTGQLPLDFESAKRERYVLLDSALRLTSAPAHVWSLVRTIESVCGETGVLRWSYADIAERHGYSVSTARRTVGTALKLGLLTKRGRCVGRLQTANELSIDWASVRQITTNRGCGQDEHPPAHVEHPPAHSDHAPLLNMSRGYGQNEHPIESLDSNRTSTTSDAWEEVEEEVRRTGVKQVSIAVGAARSNQATPDDVRDVVAWWLDRRDGFKFPKEELYYRLQVCSPDLPASEGWPDFREGYEPPEARQAREQERYWQSLVDKWKPTIDGWPESTKRKWWKDIIGDSPELRGDGESIYRRICERLEARQEATV